MRKCLRLFRESTSISLRPDPHPHHFAYIVKGLTLTLKHLSKYLTSVFRFHVTKHESLFHFFQCIVQFSDSE